MDAIKYAIKLFVDFKTGKSFDEQIQRYADIQVLPSLISDNHYDWMIKIGDTIDHCIPYQHQQDEMPDNVKLFVSVIEATASKYPSILHSGEDAIRFDRSFVGFFTLFEHEGWVENIVKAELLPDRYYEMVEYFHDYPDNMWRYLYHLIENYHQRDHDNIIMWISQLLDNYPDERFVDRNMDL